MSYDDEYDHLRQRRNRGREPIKRPGDREPVRGRGGRSEYMGYNSRSEYEYRGGGRSGRKHPEPELNLITDTFGERSGSRRQSGQSSYYEESGRSRKKAAREPERVIGGGKKGAGGKRGTGGKNGTGAVSGKRGGGTGRKDAGFYETPSWKKARKRKRKILIIILETLILLSVIVFAAYSYLDRKMSGIHKLEWNPEEIKNVDISEEKQEQMKGYWTIAIFGVDSRNSSVGKGNNSDVNIICNINQDTGEIKMVSVYRDTYLNVNDKNSYNKLNSAYLNGGPEQTVKALNKNLDLDIDDYVTFNWKAVADVINILDGVDVEISKKEFYYINAFITETVKATGVPSTPLKKAGMNHLDGVQAVAYGRLRLMDTDYARTERQRKIIELAFEKAKNADWGTLNNVIQTVYGQVSTSIELTDVIRMGRSIGKLHLGESSGFPQARGDANIGGKGACVIPQTLESNVVSLHQFLFGDESYEPTETVKTISKKIASDSGRAKAVKPVESVGTGGGFIPKTTRETEESKKETSSAKSSEGETDESGSRRETGESRDETRAWETDSYGNLILPSKGTWESTSPSPGSSESSKAETRESGGARPGASETGTQIPKPGSGTSPSNESSSGSYFPSESETTPGGAGMAPGANTGTGVIIGPGSGTSGSGGQSAPGGSSYPGGADSGGTGAPGNPGGYGGNSSSNPGGTGSPGGNVEFSGPSGY